MVGVKCNVGVRKENATRRAYAESREDGMLGIETPKRRENRAFPVGVLEQKNEKRFLATGSSVKHGCALSAQT